VDLSVEAEFVPDSLADTAVEQEEPVGIVAAPVDSIAAVSFDTEPAVGNDNTAEVAVQQQPFELVVAELVLSSLFVVVMTS
jgi:hypothetical protein